MFGWVKKAINFVQNSWRKFKKFVSGIFKKVTSLFKSNKNNENKEEQVEDSKEETKNKEEQQVEDSKEEQQVEDSKEEEKVEDTKEEEQIEETLKSAKDILLECQSHSEEELDYAILSVINDPEENKKLNSNLSSKTKARNFAANFINARFKLTGKQMTQNEKNKIIRDVREGKFFTNDKYRRQFVELMKNGLIKFAK